ncbi:MAG: hypothetical protein KF876_13335 [Nitrospira sp.]|nr:hypothetical protein [Nitrospira sp.]MDR4465670.1 hypothetical protein [Nitrospira sp.]MDR4466742.1 hypothetical protein [Nitrospira sp.]
MISDAIRDLSAFRITLFFGPEPVEKKPHTVACVFNVKKRSWKAGIQVAVEINTRQLLALRKTMALNDRLVAILKEAEPDEVSHYQERAEDIFAQALCRCKLGLRLSSGLTQENQRIDADELMDELNEETGARTEEIVASIMDELDLIPNCPSSL